MALFDITRNPKGGFHVKLPDGSSRLCLQAEDLWKLVSRFERPKQKAIGSVWDKTPGPSRPSPKDQKMASAVGEALVGELGPIGKRIAPKVGARVGKFLQKVSS